VDGFLDLGKLSSLSLNQIFLLCEDNKVKQTMGVQTALAPVR